MLCRLAREYTFERAKPFAKSTFGNFVRHDIAIEAKKRLVFLPNELTVKASVGAGVWAAVPWLAFFDPLITRSATTGFYVVYLINPQTEEIFLSMNQGTTAAYQEFGETRGQKVLQRRASDMRERIDSFASRFSDEVIDLGSETPLPKGYTSGHSFGRRYHPSNLDQKQFYADLEDMLSAYSALVDRGGITPTDSMMEEAGTTDVEETRKYVLSRRIERSPNVRKQVIERLGVVCQSCSFDPVKHVGFTGNLKNAPVDVHHSKPIRELAEGETRRYRVPDDFMVLCPTCHRLAHKQSDPSDLDALRATIQFIHAEKLPDIF